jgi:hypothetical protein
MANDLIPDDIRQFIVDKIDSVAELEGLLLMYKNSETSWNIKELSQRLYISEAQTGEVVERLHSLGFLALQQDDPPIYRYQPGSDKLAGMVGRIDEFYAKYLVPITNLIHNKPRTKVQQFADAFKLRKKEDE